MSATSTSKPTVWDTSKYWIAVGTILTYLPVGLVAIKIFGPRGLISVFLIYSVIIYLLRCSDCSWMLFKRGICYVPWPWRSCPQCARPLVNRESFGFDESLNDAEEPPNTSLERTRDR